MTRRRFSPRDLAKRLLEFEGKCACGCGLKVGGANGLEWDHIIPLELGGEDALANLQPLTKGCHRLKTAKDAGQIAKAKRLSQRASGIGRRPRAVIPGSRDSKWKKKVSGEVVRR